MEPMTLNEEFSDMVRKSGYTRKEVAEMLGVSIVSVNNWMQPTDSQNYRKIKQIYLEMLKVKLGYPMSS